MQLSEAIRLGAMLHPQCTGAYYVEDPEGETVATCALGAAHEAGYDIYSRALEIPASCPVCEFGRTLGVIVTHLNDVHEWTRERIADWVQTIEDAQRVEEPALVQTTA